ncbi:MAG: hypothetical protein GWN00_15060, partial [Aliifodinibius sp.]|nr:hypothetical protein [Fodinibius sp.]NIV12410.1 hypothetical protein [Fodinibius sp.]NIY26074.1 hypothetical protein [Fodinibius sp.]
TMTFNEPMTLSTFSDNFIVSSMHGTIPGSFRQQDSLVTFTPIEDMRPATFYEATVLGGVSDQNGNSLTLDAEWNATIWFFTAGQYSEDGFPHIFIADRSFDKLYLIGNFNEFINESSEVIQPRGMEFTPDGQSLLVVSRQLEGKLAVIDPATFTKIAEIDVGVGPQDIAISQEKIFVVNLSDKTISVLSYPGYSLLVTISFTDGYSPKNIAYNPQNNHIYVSSNALNNPGLIKVIDADTY